MNFRRKALAKIAMPIAVILILVAFSAFRAWKISADAIEAKGAPPPFYSMRFVFHPEHYIENTHDLGFQPGWVIIYAPRNKFYGTTYYVTLFGKMITSGTPTIVTMQRQHEQESIEKFRQVFARLDAAIPMGISFSNAVTILGSNFIGITNDDGSFSADFIYEPRTTYPVGWLTNGFTLLVSNDIVVRKGYSYTSSR